MSIFLSCDNFPVNPVDMSRYFDTRACFEWSDRPGRCPGGRAGREKPDRSARFARAKTVAASHPDVLLRTTRSIRQPAAGGIAPPALDSRDDFGHRCGEPSRFVAARVISLCPSARFPILGAGTIPRLSWSRPMSLTGCGSRASPQAEAMDKIMTQPADGRVVLGDYL